MSSLINLRDKSNRCDPIVYLITADQLDDSGGNGTLLRRQGYLLQLVFDLLFPYSGTLIVSPWIQGDQSKHTDEFLVQARYRPTYIELVICPRALPKARVYGRLMRNCLQEDGKKAHGKEYVVRRTFELLVKMDHFVQTANDLLKANQVIREAIGQVKRSSNQLVAE